MMGSRGYMAPEQETNAKEADERADVHALAVMVAALINGADPVPRDEALERFASQVPGSLAMPVFRATASDRKMRTPSVDRLAQGLQRALEDLDDPPRGTPPLHIPLPPPRPAR
jgi:serine/threonine protein kinase